MTPFSNLPQTKHCQTGPTLLAWQPRQNGSCHIAKAVELHSQNGSTGLVSFYECDTEVSLEGPGLCSVSPALWIVHAARQPIGGAA